MKKDTKKNINRKEIATRILCIILAFLMVSGFITTILFYLLHGLH